MGDKEHDFNKQVDAFGWFIFITFFVVAYIVIYFLMGSYQAGINCG